MFSCAAIGAFAAASLSLSSLGGGFLDLGGGWVAEWEDDVDPELILTVNGITEDGVFIEKAAFYKPGFFENGPPIKITFKQVDPNAVPYIVIQEEEVHNSTNFDWVAFEMRLDGDPDVAFDPVRTAASGGPDPIGFDVSPFDDAEFLDGNRVLRMSNGTIARGQVWQAGIGAGSLWIFGSPNTSGPFTEFTLDEVPFPAVPTPGAIALFAISGLVSLVRRRRLA